MATDPAPSDWILPRHAAKQIGVHPNTLALWIREGKLPAYRFGKAFRIPRKDWDEFVAASRVVVVPTGTDA